eukprot:8309107-Alexandrium_andersonii.AAC.1
MAPKALVEGPSGGSPPGEGAQEAVSGCFKSFQTPYLCSNMLQAVFTRSRSPSATTRTKQLKRFPPQLLGGARL